MARQYVFRAKARREQRAADNGDLLVTVYVKPHSYFIRKGMDIYSEKTISFTEAILGGEITINTIYGEQKYTVKPGTQPNTVITLKNCGVPSLRNEKYKGNQIVTLKVNIPTGLTEKAEDDAPQLE